jgi:hypothetical protein
MDSLLPTIDLCGKRVTRLICGGNPLSGNSHVSGELDREMRSYFTMAKIQELLDECEKNGINTVQSRADHHQMRMYLEHRDRGGQLMWIAQTASEYADIERNIDETAGYGAIAIYNHGTHTDNSWHAGKMDDVLAVVKAIRALGLPAGVGTHKPEVVKFIEDEGWPVDFYMCCFYDLARGYKAAPMIDRNAYARERYPAGDPAAMTAVMRAVKKPCLGFKIMAASRNCSTPDATRAAFKYALDKIKPTDAVVVGMFPKHSNQAAQNAAFVREITAGSI